MGKKLWTSTKKSCRYFQTGKKPGGTKDAISQKQRREEGTGRKKKMTNSDKWRQDSGGYEATQKDRIAGGEFTMISSEESVEAVWIEGGKGKVEYIWGWDPKASTGTKEESRNKVNTERGRELERGEWDQAAKTDRGNFGV